MQTDTGRRIAYGSPTDHFEPRKSRVEPSEGQVFLDIEHLLLCGQVAR